MSAINKTVSQSVNQLIDISKKEAEQADRQTDPSLFFLLFIFLSLNLILHSLGSFVFVSLFFLLFLSSYLSLSSSPFSI